MSPTSPRLALCALLALAVGCALPNKRARIPTIRPASTLQKEGGDDVSPRVLFPPPFALAVVEDAIVRIVGPKMTCSGTLIEDDLVLTAHHCLVDRGPHGEFKKTHLSPESIRIELGGDYLPWGSVGVKSIVTPLCGESGGAGDVAILVLTRKLVGLSTMTPRLDQGPQIGERLDPVGFGRCAMSSDGIRRKARDGGTVRATTSETIELSASICPGDSGGPILSLATYEVVGVISLSAMDGDDRTSSPSVFARIDAYRKVFGQARAIADGSSPNELPPLECE